MNDPVAHWGHTGQPAVGEAQHAQPDMHIAWAETAERLLARIENAL